MLGASGRKRARTTDRELAVEAITLAYVDGQIGAADRDERVSRALTTSSLDGLRPLLADLQVPSHVRLPEPDGAKASAPARVASKRGRSYSWAESRLRFQQASRWEKTVLLAAVVGGPLALLAAVAVGADDQPAAIDLHSAPGIEQLVDDVEDEFGSTQVLEVELHDTWARVFVPIEGTARYRHYTYGNSDARFTDTEFSDSGQGGTTEDAAPDLIDLAALDAARLAGNIEQARLDLGVEGDVDVMVTLADERMATDFSARGRFASGERDMPAHVEISLVNEFFEEASLTTDLSGQELGREPRE